MSRLTFSMITVAVIAGVTISLRFLPFVIFSRSERIPGWVTYLGKVLPYSIMVLLVVFCLKDISFTSGSHGIPECIAAAIVVGLHMWKHNTLISVAAGTVSYMLMVQLIFR